MNELAALAIVYLVYRVFFRKPYVPESYIPIDLPTIRLYRPPREGEDIEAIKERFIPRVTPQYVPPGITLALSWPVQYEQTFLLSKQSTRRVIDGLVWAIKNDLWKTRIWREGDELVIDFPTVNIPV